MNVRQQGIRRIKYVTRGLTVAGVAGSVLFAGLAQAATERERANTPKLTPTTRTSTAPSTPTTPRHRPSQLPADQPPADQPPADQPPVTSTDEPPQITGGGS